MSSISGYFQRYLNIFLIVLSFLWILMRLGNEITFCEKGVFYRWYGTNTKFWRWTEFEDTNSWMYKTKTYHGGTMIGFAYEQTVRLISKRGTLLIDARYKDHQAFANFALDCCKNKGMPQKSLEDYINSQF